MKNEIEHPEYYGGKDNPYECIKVIEALGHGESFAIGNILKYIFRAGKKENKLEDLKKAKFYMDWLVEKCDEKNSAIE